MDMKVAYTVHAIIPSKKRKMVDHEGAQVAAEIPAVEVHLFPVEEGQGSVTLRYAGAKAELALEKFLPGDVCTMDFEFAEDDKKKSEAA